MRYVADNITQWSCDRYFFFWQGDEILLKATNDADAIAEGALLEEELTNYQNNC